MRCSYCGYSMEKEQERCPSCGKMLQVQLQETKDQVTEYEGPMGTSKPAFTWGLLASVLGSTLIGSPLGIIFGLVGLLRAKNFERYTGSLYGRGRVGKILSVVGIVVGSALTMLLLAMGIISITQGRSFFSLFGIG